MLTREDDAGAHALSRQGWTISAMARHLGHNIWAIMVRAKSLSTDDNRR